MCQYKKPFLGAEAALLSLDRAKVVVVPVPYEGGVSYGRGARHGPDAILDASSYLELYDDQLDCEPYTIGIFTIPPLEISDDASLMMKQIYETTSFLLKRGKFVVLLGGDHSITTGYCRALSEAYGSLSVIQIDAHADLRDSYEGSFFSHASVMSRLREITTETLQIGIRSLSREEADRIKKDNLDICMMHEIREHRGDLHALIDRLPDPVFITFDVDVFDWSVIRSTGTPEPGGFTWDEGISLLNHIFSNKNVVGFDVVELSYDGHDSNSAFAAAKLIYKMIGFKFKLSAKVQ
jgi:agmatinase